MHYRFQVIPIYLSSNSSLIMGGVSFIERKWSVYLTRPLWEIWGRSTWKFEGSI